MKTVLKALGGRKPFSHNKKKRKTWLMNNEMFDLNWFDLYETLGWS